MPDRPPPPPLLTGSEAARARSLVDELLESLPEPSEDWPAALDGLAGAALLFHHAAQQPGRARAYAAAAVERAGDEALPLGLYHGLAGIGWAATTVAPDLLEPSFDPRMTAALAAPRWEDDFDLVSGLSGLGAWSLRRGPAGSAGARAVLDHLEVLATRTSEGLTWTTPRDRLPPTLPPANGPVILLGVAHGLSGVIGFCAGCVASGVEVPRALRLLEGAIDFLLAHRLPPELDGIHPPAVAEGLAPRTARSAWCHGDPGIAAALSFAAGAAGRPGWLAHALELARKVATRAPEASRVEDPTLCHGAAGLGHLLHRVFLATSDPLLATAARDWFARALEMLEGGVELSPTGLLEGAPGVGLTLLSAVGATDLSWDSVLLLSPACRV